MFTGLVEQLGIVEVAQAATHGVRFQVRWPGLTNTLQVGESIAVNGCCLTVVEQRGEKFGVEAGPETLARTNLGSLVPGSAVNLERALRVGDRLGGHFVQGHIDTTATLREQREEGDWRFLYFSIDKAWTPLMVEKGSIALDGVSLTLVSVKRDAFSVMLIPHTLAVTTLGRLQIGNRVNVEIDMIAKHIQKLIGQIG